MAGAPVAKGTSRSKKKPLLGAHMSIAGGPAKALERGRSIGCSAIQIFVKNNMQWTAKPFSEADLESYRNFSDKPKVVFGHASYLINPGANNPEFAKKSLQALIEELDRADQLEVPFLVLHPGSHMGDGEKAGIQRVAASLDKAFRALPDGKCKIALEITAGQGSSLGHTFEQLAKIIDSSKFAERLSICLDTAHLFEAGYDIGTADGFWNTWKQFAAILGGDRLAAWHLNDSKTGLGSRVDRHEHIGRGKIGLMPFREIMQAKEFRKIPKVLETPKGEDLAEDVKNMNVLLGLVVGR